MDPRLTHQLAATRADDFRREAVRSLRAREARPPAEDRDEGHHRLASVATALHIHRPSLRFLRG